MVFDLKVIILVAVVAAVVGAVVGYVLAMAGQRRAGGGKSVAELAEEHESYRDGVAEHFKTTAQLLHEMTDKYRDVYKHMAEGAQTLVTSESALPALEQLRGDLVRHQDESQEQADQTDIVEPGDVAAEIDDPQALEPIIEPSTSEPQAASASAQDAPDGGATAEDAPDNEQPSEEKAFFSDAAEPDRAGPTVISESTHSQGSDQTVTAEAHETPRAAGAG